MALGKKTGGRVKGTPNKRNGMSSLADSLIQSGLLTITPIQFMLQIMNDRSANMKDRFEAARAAAPYIHPKLATVEHTGGISLSHEEALDLLDGEGDSDPEEAQG